MKVSARMVATPRRYTKAEKQAFHARQAKRRRTRVWLNGCEITDLLKDVRILLNGRPRGG